MELETVIALAEMVVIVVGEFGLPLVVLLPPEVQVGLVVSTVKCSFVKEC